MQESREKLPPWRETPLDHWSKEIDPVIMAGDEWVDNDADPGAQKIEEKGGDLNHPAGERFLHPTLDTNYGVDDDVFLSKGLNDQDSEATNESMKED